MITTRLLIVVCTYILSISAHATTYDISGSFVQYGSDGGQSVSGAWPDGVTGTYDDTTGSISMILNELYGFYNIPIAGNVITVPGIYSWEACLADGSIQCTAPSPIQADIGAGQWGMHALYDWYTFVNIDLVNVWDVSVGPGGIISLSVIDSDGDGVLGVAQVDGAFPTLSLALNLTLTPTTVPVPAALWLLGSGLLGLVGISLRKKTR
jgi:hypothetical protein